VNDLVLRAVLQLVWLAIAGFLLNLVFGVETGLAFFGLAAAALLLYHVSNMGRLARWLEQPTPGQVPRASGAWDQLFALLYRYERVNNRDHQELAKTLVGFRQAAGAHPHGVVRLDADNRIDW
jgi:two-component system phosphate regulon sensor histidine kinase PhoR